MGDSRDILKNKIQIDKEILSVMPRNNKKNVEAFTTKVEEIRTNYKSYQDDVVMEIRRRVNRINSVTQNTKIQELKDRIAKLEKLDFFFEVRTSYEKMKIDENIFRLRTFYKKSLEQINNDIAGCIDAFERAGVILTPEDFNYSPFVYKYMEKFLVAYKSGNVNTAEIKDAFEKIYWDCSDLIIHIELNIRYLYLKNKKTIDKYYESEDKRRINDLGLTESNFLKKYSSLIEELKELELIDKKNMVDKFVNKELDVNELQQKNVEKQYASLLTRPMEEYSERQLTEITENILKLSKSLDEYQKYMSFKFILDRIMKIYQNKEEYKNIYETEKKDIQREEALLFKLNKKYEKAIKGGLFVKNSEEDIKNLATEINTKILDIRNLYRKIDIDKVKEKISTELTSNSTIYDALYLVSGYYTFLVETIISEFKDIPENEINSKIVELRKFITGTNITVLDSITITDERSVTIMIKDKYKLFNININKEDFEEDNIEKLEGMVKVIKNGYYLEKSGVILEDMDYLLKANKLLDKIEIQD